jgi:serine protease Do
VDFFALRLVIRREAGFFPVVRLLCLLFALPLAATAATSRGFNRLLDAVVRIDVREVSFESGVKRYTGGIGSGVILNDDGFILTNAHVASPRAENINITLANLERVNARLVGWDHWTDLALLQLDLTDLKRRGLKFSHADLGDSEKMQPGDPVYAVGTPYGLTRTVTRGIISNNRRTLDDLSSINGYETGLFNTWLQTDAAINPGNSGGPLVTEDGRVVGINSRGNDGAQSLGFAIPINVAKRVVAELARTGGNGGLGAVTRSYLGLGFKELQGLEEFYKQSTGVLINNVDLGSPAAKAGLKPNDILLALDGKVVDGRFPEQLPPILDLIASKPVGATVKLAVRRRDPAGAFQTTDYVLVTEKLESRQGEAWAFEKWGLAVRKVSRAYARENQLEDANGLLVTGVQNGFPAAVAGLGRNDVITKINNEPITSLEAARKLYESLADKADPVLVESRNNRQVSNRILKPKS